MANIRITDKQTVTPTGSDFMLINQAGSDKNTTLARLKTYTNGSAALETVAQDQNSAINEVNKIATNNSTAINGINTKIGSGTLETTSQNYVGAINEINKKVGNEKLETVAENTTGAVNELNKKIGNIDVENDGTVATQLNEKAKQTDLNTTNINVATNTTDIAKLKGYAEYNISASTTIADNTNIYLTLDTVVKAGSLTELSGGGIKIKESGMYEINAMTNFNTSSAGHRKIGIYKNDVLVKLIAFAPNNNVTVAQIIANLDCVLNDIIKIGVYQNSGASLTNITNSIYSGVQVRRIG